jgi:hypothetical protein
MPTIKLRRGSKDQWTTSNPILADGEMGVELDTGLLKVGNGFQHWEHLPYFYPNVSRMDLLRLEDRINQGLTSLTIDDISDVAFTTLQDGEAIVWSVDPDRGDAFRNINLDSKYVSQNRIGNLLTPNQASGTDVLGTTAGFDQLNGYNWVGVRSFEFPSARVGSRVLAASQGPVADGFIVMTDKISIRSDSALTYKLSIYWNGTINSGYSQPVHSFYDSAGQRIGSWVYGQTMDCPTQKWFDVSQTIPSSQIPAGTRYISFGFNFPYGNPSGTEAYIDRLGLWEGAGGDWAMPGTPILNQTLRVVAPETVDIWDGEAWTSLVRPLGNLLTPNQASGTDVLGTTDGFLKVPPSAVIESSTEQAAFGSRSLSAVYNSDGWMEVVLSCAVHAGETYTFTGSVRKHPSASVSAFKIYVRWYQDDSKSAILRTDVSANRSITSDKWAQQTDTFIAPSGATLADLSIVFLADAGLAVGDKVYIDRLGIWQGAGGDWAMPGTPILNQTLRVVAPESVDMWGGEAWIPLVRPLGNLLSEAMASLESAAYPPDTVCGWAPDGGTGTLVDGGSYGQKALRITAPTQAWGVKSFSPYEFIPVREGVAYTLSADMKAVMGTREWRILVNWQRSADYKDGTHISSDVASIQPSAQWRTATATFIAPPGARYANVRLSPVQTGAEGDACDYDRIGFWEGAGGDWAMPGTPITNLGRRVSRPNGTDRLVEVWDGSDWVPIHYDSGWRDITGLVTPGPGTTLNALRVRRSNANIEFLASWNQASDAPTAMTCTQPYGFRGSNLVDVNIPLIQAGGELAGEFYTTNGRDAWEFLPLAGQGVRSYGVIRYHTDDSIPTSLPGTTVTIAP